MGTDSYTWDASDYASHSGEQSKWAGELIAKLALSGSEDLLDIGCGHGQVSATIARLLPRGSVLGIDKSADMISYATRRFTGPQYPNLSFRRLDATELAFDAQFDAVFSSAALHWVRDHQAVLCAVRRSLRDSGRVLLQMGGRGNASEVVSSFERLTSRPEWQPYFRGFAFPFWFYSPHQYEDWLHEAGLVPVRVELLAKDMRHDGEEGLAGWIRTTWLPYVERVPVALRSRFIDEFVAHYTARHPVDGEGIVHVGMVRLEVEAAS